MTFAHPWGLALLAAAGPLVLLYVLRRRRERRVVGSTLLWARLAEDARADAPWERFRRSLLLLLQLGALAAMALAAAGPGCSGRASPAEAVAIVLDGSASMAARTAAGRTRFEEAAAAGARAARDLVGNSRGIVILAGAEPHVLAPLGTPRGSLLAAIRSARATEAPADLPAAVALARSALRGAARARILVFSDSREELPAPGPGLFLERHSAGDPAPNAGIVAFSIRAVPGAVAELRVFARVAAFGESPVAGRLELRRDGIVVLLEPVVLEPGIPLSRVYPLPAGDSGDAASVELSWVSESGPDAFPLDDRVAAPVQDAGPLRVLVTGPPDPYLNRALAAHPRIRLDRAEIEAGDLSTYDLVVCRGAGPRAPNGPPVFWVAPHGSDRRLPIRGLEESPSWRGARPEHALLRFTDLSGVRIARAPRVERPSGMETVAETTAGPLLLAGVLLPPPPVRPDPRARPETWGRRAVILALDPLESDLPLRVAWPILVQNTVAFLARDDSEAARLYPTGERPTVAVPSGSSTAVLETPDGLRVPLSVQASAVRLPPLEQTGLYRLIAGERAQRLGAALLSAQESDLSLPPPGTARLPQDSAVPVPGGGAALPLPLAALFVGATLVALLVEWTVFHRRLAD